MLMATAKSERTKLPSQRGLWKAQYIAAPSRLPLKRQQDITVRGLYEQEPKRPDKSLRSIPTTTHEMMGDNFSNQTSRKASRLWHDHLQVRPSNSSTGIDHAKTATDIHHEPFMAILRLTNHP